jgi:hypothetical protein
MLNSLILEYWTDDDWYVGRLKEDPGSSARVSPSLSLRRNIRDVYQLLLASPDVSPAPTDPGLRL